MKMIDRLFDGPLDIVGDIHGEYDALIALMAKLNYADDGLHPDGRRLVFVGDLVDRGHDSPAVVEKLMALVKSGCAQCVLGNHEINILRDDIKSENQWFFNSTSATVPDTRTASTSQQTDFLKFFGELPIALERDDLRIVHASWNLAAIAEIRGAAEKSRSTLSLYRRYQDKVRAQLASGKLKDLFDDERSGFGERIAYGRNDPKKHWPNPRMLPGHAWYDETEQMGNPMSVLTSGEERGATKVYPAGGKFRFVDRVSWWDDYDEQPAVVMGHYWRRYHSARVARYRQSGWDLFAGIAPWQWLGKRQNVFCIDFSVAGRASDRGNEQLVRDCRLAALRWPETTLMFDDGEEIATNYPCQNRQVSPRPRSPSCSA